MGTAQAKASEGLFQKLSNIKLGGGKAKKVKFKKKDLIHIMRNLSTLIENGMTLPKALQTIIREKALKKYSEVLDGVRVQVESGEMFSAALEKIGGIFTDIMINQIRVGERSGTLPDTIQRLTAQLENSDDLKGQIIKKLSYPVMLVTLGSGAVSFMLLFVVPTFQKTYEESGAKLPMITQVLIKAGELGTAYGWIVITAIVGLVVSIIVTRRSENGKLWMDTWMLKIPIFGEWLTNLAVLQFMDVLGNLMEAGFTIVDALKVCAGSINNRAIRKSISKLHSAILRGEKFSAELERLGDLFPPVVTQLVIIGEKTGTLAKSTKDIRAHLQREVQRVTNAMLGTIKPVMTIGLAICIGGIVLAIYLPMFDMIGAMNN
jgi:type II secretory pathway component PulF